MTDRRVVITGMGVVSPLGNDLKTSWEGLREGRSGIRRIESLDPEPYPSQIGGEVRGLNPADWFNNPRDARRADRYTHLAMAAAKMAVEDAQISADTTNPDRVGIFIGSGIGGLGTLEAQHTTLMQRGPKKVSPLVIPMMISNMASGMAAMEFGFGGPNISMVSACATSNHAIGEAWRVIKFGDADAFVAGGSEASILPMGLSGFANMKALSTRNDEPERASRPFDEGRDGFVIAEGGGVFFLEELEHARKRGARIYAELVGYGATADAYPHLTAPHPEGMGARRCMEMAMKHAGLNTDELDYLNAHATSTPVGDIAETKAIKATFGQHAKEGLQISATKSMTGHLLGGAGGFELAACVMAIYDGVIPPTINLEKPDPECDLDYVPNTARECAIKTALSNSFGFGGHNASLLVRKFD